jgi:hypothetical protein
MEHLYTNEDGSTTKYTPDMINNVIKDRDYYRTSHVTYISRLNQLREEVYNFFKDRYDSGDSEITVTVEDVNEMLVMIGAGSLKALFTVTGTINFVVTDIEAETEQEANDIVHDTMNLDFGGDGNLDEWDIDISDTSQQ